MSASRMCLRRSRPLLPIFQSSRTFWRRCHQDGRTATSAGTSRDGSRRAKVPRLIWDRPDPSQCNPGRARAMHTQVRQADHAFTLAAPGVTSR
jgi:hypothetical protein